MLADKARSLDEGGGRWVVRTGAACRGRCSANSPQFNSKPGACCSLSSALMVPAGFRAPHPRHPDGPGHMVGGGGGVL